MSGHFRKGLLAARAQIALILGLSLAFAAIIALEMLSIEFLDTKTLLRVSAAKRLESTRPQQPLPAPAPLSKQEQDWAKIAWQYFKDNTRKETGLVDSVSGYPATTLWDTASAMMGVIAAKRLDIISQDEFDRRTKAFLNALEKLPLYDDVLPNKSYNTLSLAMTDYNNAPAPEGIGWSAIDIGRIFVPLNILTWHEPQHTKQVRRLVAQWDMTPMLREGTTYGAARTDSGETLYVQEGRLGYEEYAAKSFSLIGRDVAAALDYADTLKFVTVAGQEIAVDSREAERYGAHNYIVSESYILDGIEYGWDTISAELAWRIYTAQRNRYDNTGILTAVSEDHIDRAPYFVYNTVYANGKAWNAITQEGEDASAHRSLSTKAAFGWHMLYRTPYTQKLLEAVAGLHDPEKGWYSGRYEADGRANKALTANTNGIILEALAYKAEGVLVR